ncbi:Lipase 1 [Arthrobacter sp. Bi83]|uniref:alpha/beta fold hydrolase n=1 Tax=Arthrobacter sp. Bi83 TaxID=2822353 RepID=UPI001DBADE4E|nr:alpha/beta hydrolase [Arthrobacter sp. Bi83]CAH0132605.1 Lipase 1 [Arthrobacter sp. Bi83]
MRIFPHRTARPPAVTAPGAGYKRPRRWLRVTGIVALIAVVLGLASTAANLLFERAEKSSIAAYGERIQISSGALNVYRNGHTGQPLVLLSGLGTAAPALDFAPLIRELGNFDVTVVEGFGYGYSDMSARERSTENISKELHEVLTKLNIKRPYVLAGHSIAGFYTLDYANRYPKEVSAVIGIDATIPKAESGPVELPLQDASWERIPSVTGLVRIVGSVAPGLVNPDGDAYTADELERMRLMQSWNFGNQAVVDETARIGNNAAALRGVKYPDGLPVLAFISDEKTPETQTKQRAAEKLLNNVRGHEIVTLDGGHYLHWTQSKRMAELITTFLAKDH